MNQIDQRLARLEKEGEQMIELERMSDPDLRAYLQNLSTRFHEIQDRANTEAFLELARILADLRGEIGMVMRACEIRALR
ncbi:MAG: hypothetical protein COA47_04670 [Robiginitomaculum sp.]|nr:MAG: hypothetical protein COA47_04670 [Robiginitomaculum sp.]